MHFLECLVRGDPKSKSVRKYSTDMRRISTRVIRVPRRHRANTSRWYSHPNFQWHSALTAIARRPPVPANEIGLLLIFPRHFCSWGGLGRQPASCKEHERRLANLRAYHHAQRGASWTWHGNACSGATVDLTNCVRTASIYINSSCALPNVQHQALAEFQEIQSWLWFHQPTLAVSVCDSHAPSTRVTHLPTASSLRWKPFLEEKATWEESVAAVTILLDGTDDGISFWEILAKCQVQPRQWDNVCCARLGGCTSCTDLQGPWGTMSSLATASGFHPSASHSSTRASADVQLNQSRLRHDKQTSSINVHYPDGPSNHLRIILSF